MTSMDTAAPPQDMQTAVANFQKNFRRLQSALSSRIVGHAEIVEGVLTAFLAGGHCLLEGVPGLGKTLLVKTLSEATDAHFSRIQFTPDLMPADILGTHLVIEDAATRAKRFEFQKGPIFGNIILADEINRATPKTQSALLEAMEERQVTLGSQSHTLAAPFFVVATQNPIELEGTYPLPEAQLDRFFFKLLVQPSGMKEMVDILDLTTAEKSGALIQSLPTPAILEMMKLVRLVPANRDVKELAARIVLATHPVHEHDSKHKTMSAARYLKFGASPRGAQALILAGKVLALTQQRYNVSRQDVLRMTKPALRHRIILNFEAEAEGITSDQVLDEILSTMIS